ncbi:MAG: hypothetical protein JWR02_2603 [Mucilaginibacter sp.]|nr:hypothetical protein [Mucilaginibacter sp.]
MSQNIASQSFIKGYHRFKSDTTFEAVVLFKNNFYCLESNSQVLVINTSKNQVDYSYKDNSKEVKLESLYLVNDSLIGVSRFNTYYLEPKNHKWIFLKERRKAYPGYPIFEDDEYFITSTCSGEWGGTIYFLNKKTKKIYKSACTCAVNVIKENNKYNVTASLAHMSGFTNIFEVENPMLLVRHHEDINRKKIGYVGDNESRSKKGTNQIIDSVGVETLASFKYNSKIYYLVEKHGAVYLDYINNKKLTVVDDLTNLNIQGNYPVNRYCSGKSIYTYKNDKNTGFVLIGDGLLTFYSFDWRHK